MDETTIQLLSDLHLEAPKAYDIFEVPVNAPHLALLGDIGYTTHNGLFAFLQAQLSKFKTVFFLLGNHEPYYSSWAASKARLTKFGADMKTRQAAGEHTGIFVFLDQTPQEERVSFGLNDFYYIEDWSVPQHNTAHANDLTWLNSEVEKISQTEPQRHITIFSHHCPTADRRAVDPDQRDSPISSGFCTDVADQLCWTSKSVTTWAFGHTHFNCDFEDGNWDQKRVVANQRGYYFKQAGAFDASKTLSA